MVVGDGEAETGPLATSWQSNKFINAKKDGAVLPILHLNGYKISGPTVFGRMANEKLEHFFKGCSYTPCFVEGDDPKVLHKVFWETLDWAYGEIQKNKKGPTDKAVDWPMIIMRTPKGWTGPKIVDGKKVEGTFRSHQVPLSDVIDNKEHMKQLEEWLQSYRPEELFDEGGRPNPEYLKIVPEKDLRMGASPHANGGLLMKELKIPDYTKYEVKVPRPGSVIGEADPRVWETRSRYYEG